MGPDEDEKLLYRRGRHHLKKEAAYRKGLKKKNPANYTSDRGLVPRTYKELKKEKEKNPPKRQGNK